MKRYNDMYNLGNDYEQDKAKYFVTADAEASAQAGIATYKAYSDGLYHYTTVPVYELSGGASALNKRIYTVLPQSAWAEPDFEGVESFSAINAASAVLSPDYATGIVVGEGSVEKEWEKPVNG